MIDYNTVVPKLITTINAGLSQGLGSPIPGQMCVEAAVCYAMGLPHSDDPGCVALSVRALKIKLNDQSWSSNASRAKGMLRLAIAQLGSKGVVDDTDFVKQVAEMTIRKIVPIAIRTAGLRKEADRCEAEGSYKSALAAYAAAARAASAADVAALAASAARAASAADVAALAASAADAVDAASAAHARAAAAAAYYTGKTINDPDKIMSMFAEEVVQILIALKSPGCEYMYMVERNT